MNQYLAEAIERETGLHHTAVRAFFLGQWVTNQDMLFTDFVQLCREQAHG